ncbi:Abi family protein [Cetobacterium somerae]|uniref:Abi family protein n=1 Tax=Cetobacterium somerae TaxID=188913 RepID=UPI00248D7E6B|nr:Abi family protein [Cetobacterium somerae]
MPHRIISKTIEEQIEIFKNRGMVFENEEYAKNKLSHINYYKLKEYSLVFMENARYENITFEEVLDTFYLDRSLRVNLMHNIEKIEISLKTQIARILGSYGPFEYLSFNIWVDKDEYCKHYIKDQEKKFKEQIRKILLERSSEIIKEFQKNFPGEDKVPIWMLIEMLTLGEVLNLYKLMAPNLKKKISKFYNIPSIEIFESWIYKIKLIRNLCAHNMKIYNLTLSKTKTLNEWAQIGIDYNKLPIILLIIQHFINEINPNYKSRTITTILAFLKKYPTKRANFGLRNENALKNILKYKNKKPL